jgi:hypothetical protein
MQPASASSTPANLFLPSFLFRVEFGRLGDYSVLGNTSEAAPRLWERAMPNVSACPGFSLFEQLAQGLLADSVKESLLAHLEGCPACAQRVGTLLVGDTLVDLIRQADTLLDVPEPATVGPLMEKLRQLGPAGDSASQVATAIARGPVASSTLSCPGCGRKVRIKGNPVGRAVQCPHCQVVIHVRAPDQQGAPGIEHPPAASSGVHATPRPHRGQETIGPHGREEATCYDLLAPPQEPDELGRLGSYRVLDVLGSGGMGVVFQAEDMQLKRQVALKVMLPALARDPSAKDRFLREARAAAAVKHPHVVTIHQVGEDRNVPFLALELLQGEALEQRLRREGKLPRKEMLRIGREIAEGLAAAHATGLVHRDIKPANIWLEAPHDHVKILDFGLACASSSDARLTQTGVIVGTPAYMCPEQANGSNPDPRGDLFSLGCVLYKMCTGELPFQAPDAISTLVAVVCQEPKSVLDFDPALPEAFGDLVARLLQKKPEDRPASAEKVAQRIAQQEKGKSRTATPRPRRAEAHTAALTPTRRRTPIVAAVAAFVLLALGGFWLGSTLFRSKTAEGTVVLAADDDGVEVRITQSGKEIAVMAPRKGKELSLQAGKYEAELVTARYGLRLKPTTFTLAEGERVVLEVRFDSKDVGFPGKKGPKGDGPPDGPWGDEGPHPKGPKDKGPWMDKGPGGPPDKGPKDKGDGLFGPGKKGMGPKGRAENIQAANNYNTTPPEGAGYVFRKGPPFKKD